ncbi:MAG: prepilin-type N-terminal cleavage/methylation domain-containing protein [Candidatus Electrothrix scaldis]|nr:MAG: prepilin-type N-terminal cleavage/methylation domain-containing protein [Candidatus Electrothrix sp. GW3-3]
MTSPDSEQAGFTLLEIMLAVLILGLVVAMVTTALSGSINAIDATITQGDLYYRAQVAMERINEDLSSALLTNDMEFIGQSGSDSSEQTVLLSFSSLAHLVLDPKNDQPGLGRIHYALQADPDQSGHLLLVRSDALQRPTEDGEESGEVEAYILADQLRSVDFTFYDYQGEEQENWDTTVDEEDEEAKAKRRLPAAVTCRLEFWVDIEAERTIVFQTTVLLPTGLIQAQPEEDS